MTEKEKGVFVAKFRRFGKKPNLWESLNKCPHENIKREDGLGECLDCGIRNY